MSARSSDSIRHIAKALAAAQRDLQNPQARHEGQIRRELPSGLALIEPCRFASLGDGLALIRPVLGRHGLSLIQATRLDSHVGLVILETRIIHESGEWILADYPVAGLPQGGASDPRELGAALTYARRQSLFSLIGIAPQNDTDGRAHPEILPNASSPAAISDDRPGPLAPENTALRQGEGWVGEGARARPGATRADAGPILSRPTPEAMGRSPGDMMRVLAGELEALSSHAELRTWAIERVKVMASLLPQDRRRLNEVFLARRSAIEGQGDTKLHDGEQTAHQEGQSTEPLPGASGTGGAEHPQVTPARGIARRGAAKSCRTQSVNASPKATAAGGALP